MRILLLGIGLFVLLYLFIRFLEAHSLYFPMKGIMDTPQRVNLRYEDVYFKTQDGTQLHGWYVGEGRPYVLLFAHGNGGNISHRLEKLNLLRDIEADVFIFDYRGYGQSQGKPAEKGLYLDMEAAYQYLVDEKKYDPTKIIIYGESLGAAVGIDLAVRHPVGGLIVEEAFTSVPAMAKAIYPILPAWMVKSRYDSLSKIKSVTCPKLFFHSLNDEIVPYRMGQELFEKAEEPKRFIPLRGGHNEAFWDSKDTWVSGVENFLTEIR